MVCHRLSLYRDKQFYQSFIVSTTSYSPEWYRDPHEVIPHHPSRARNDPSPRCNHSLDGLKPFHVPHSHTMSCSSRWYRHSLELIRAWIHRWCCRKCSPRLLSCFHFHHFRFEHSKPWNTLRWRKRRPAGCLLSWFALNSWYASAVETSDSFGEFLGTNVST